MREVEGDRRIIRVGWCRRQDMQDNICRIGKSREGSQNKQRHIKQRQGESRVGRGRVRAEAGWREAR
jgi:hypothetical protein